MKSAWTINEVAELRRLRESGLTFYEIGQQLGRSKKACRHKFNLGTEGADLLEATPELESRITELLRKGKTFRQIGDEIGARKHQVAHLVHQMRRRNGQAVARDPKRPAFGYLAEVPTIPAVIASRVTRGIANDDDEREASEAIAAACAVLRRVRPIESGRSAGGRRC